MVLGWLCGWVSGRQVIPGINCYPRPQFIDGDRHKYSLARKISTMSVNDVKRHK